MNKKDVANAFHKTLSPKSVEVFGILWGKHFLVSQNKVILMHRSSISSFNRFE